MIFSLNRLFFCECLQKESWKFRTWNLKKKVCWQGIEKFGESCFCENELREKKCWDYLVYEVCDGKIIRLEFENYVPDWGRNFRLYFCIWTQYAFYTGISFLFSRTALALIWYLKAKMIVKFWESIWFRINLKYYRKGGNQISIQESDWGYLAAL